MFIAYTLNVLIASPGDTKEQRDAIRTTILKWNDSNSRFYQVTLLPVMWETHSYPAIGRPQGIINVQIVADADILIGTFWTRLGTPTVVAESGTAEEISEFENSGRPVLLYFCEAPAPILTLDTAEIERLKKYRRQMQSKALVGSYVTEEELCEKVREDLTRLVRKMKEEGEYPPLPNLQEAPDSPRTSNSDSSPGVENKPDDLDDLRRALIGYKARWQGQFASMNVGEAFSIDNRHALMENAARVLWELVQRVGERCPDASIIDSLSAAATEADQFAEFRVYLDGGVTFNALNAGCQKTIDDIQKAIDQSWECRPPRDG